MDDASLSQLEIVTLLCMSDRTHSQLIELMPERCGEGQSRDFEDVLSVVCIAMNGIFWTRHTAETFGRVLSD